MPQTKYPCWRRPSSCIRRATAAHAHKATDHDEAGSPRPLPHNYSIIVSGTNLQCKMQQPLYMAQSYNVLQNDKIVNSFLLCFNEIHWTDICHRRNKRLVATGAGLYKSEEFIVQFTMNVDTAKVSAYSKQLQSKNTREKLTEESVALDVDR